MTRVWAFAGKGSSGKTALVSLLVDAPSLRAVARRVLVIDVDPQQSLTRALGVAPPHTIGSLRSAYERQFKLGQDLPDAMTREAFAEAQMGKEARIRVGPIDFLALGQWDLPGSQCTTHRVLERGLGLLMADYDLVILDHEAGIEHIGRYQHVPLDRLILVSTLQPEFLAVADAIYQAAIARGRTVRELHLVLNRTLPGDPDAAETPALLAPWLSRAARLTWLPESPALATLSRGHSSPTTLPADDPLRAALDRWIVDGCMPAPPARAVPAPGLGRERTHGEGSASVPAGVPQHATETHPDGFHS